ncbi:MAG: Modification methylase BspRI [Dehalococcoidia bacterium]|nr:Modification methylase BspRI [Chloroflexota bacterium]
MANTFKTVDLFAGPGGLAEGFASLRDSTGTRVFEIALSIEKEPSAFATLRLRAFTRQFRELPAAYYQYVAGSITLDALKGSHPAEWKAAEKETELLELGTDAAKSVLDPRLDGLRAEDARTVIIGGPPCQAYSLVGRARNRGIRGYVPAEDGRHFLYREYIRILEKLQPAAFVMENVKGMLSATVDGETIFHRIVDDLKGAGGASGTYELLPIVPDGRGLTQNIIRSEHFGIPQARHRVVLVGVRSDILARIPEERLRSAKLQPQLLSATVADVLEGMPKLRSGLSREEDGPDQWRNAVVKAFKFAAAASRRDSTWLADVAATLNDYARRLAEEPSALPRSSDLVAPISNNHLSDWLTDRRLAGLANHETRGHMESDLARYAFAASFAEVFDRSPKASEFPRALAPDHRNWETGKFADRFRVQCWKGPSTTVTSHISKDGHYFIHPDPMQCRSLTVREAARLQTFPDNYFFEGNRTQQFVQVGNAVPPLLARQIAEVVQALLT